MFGSYFRTQAVTFSLCCKVLCDFFSSFVVNFGGMCHCQINVLCRCQTKSFSLFEGTEGQTLT